MSISKKNELINTGCQEQLGHSKRSVTGLFWDYRVAIKE